MENQTDAHFDAAQARGLAMLETEPRAVSVQYNRLTGRISVDLMNGCTYVFPSHLVEDLINATHDNLEKVEIDGLGFNLHWPKLDADLYVPALVAGVFGTSDWMSKAMARQAGRSKSAAKAEAARLNGAKGGRPKRRA